MLRYPGQTTTLEQYPESSMKMPQVDALRRARMSTGSQPLYSSADEVMGGAKPQAEPAYGATSKPAPEAKFGTKPAGEFGTKPMMIGPPTRGMPQRIRPAMNAAQVGRRGGFR